ncbi:MAG: hypothetical protein K6E20_03745 [Acholeplasmatales bacterium]|nr:hypothetical protein [Acholeplasmatales bacterium]
MGKILNRYKTKRILWIMALVFTIILVLSIVAIEIYVWVTYGDKPVDEIPLWALWFMFGGNR